MKDKFRKICKWISKITLKVIKVNKLKGAHQIFFKFRGKLPSFQKINVEKSTFCNMRFKERH